MKYIIFIISILSHVGFAQEFDKTKLDNYFDALEANNKFMGSVAVSKMGKVIYTKSVGYSDVENKTKSTELTAYRIGSISKTFTAVLVLKGVEMKKINLNQTIDKYFPSIKNSNKITISHLLYHRSGIHNFTSDSSYLKWNTEAKTEKEMIAVIAKGGSDFEPGSKFGYSNSNYVILTYILEKAFKKPFADLLAEYITKPLGLENTHLGEQAGNKLTKSYSFNKSWEVQPVTDISVPLGAGGIVSTATDLVKFSDALFGGKIIKKESLDKMKTLKDNFGMGLLQYPFYDMKAFGHTGGIDGFSSVFGFLPDSTVSYALLSNGSNYDNNNITIAVLSAVFDKPFTLPEFKTYEVSPADLDKYVGVYSSAQIPLKITITKNNNTLTAQASGQPAFPLEATEKDRFVFEKAGVVIDFNPAENTMILKQAGGEFKFSKE